jgi:small subunit ribosomal protein S4
VRIQDSLALAEQFGFPEWIDVDPKKMQGVFKNPPDRSELPSDINESLVVELYSK